MVRQIEKIEYKMKVEVLFGKVITISQKRLPA
jgi:hypothetical protein